MKGCSFRNYYFQELWTAEFQENNALLLGKEDEACGVDLVVMAGCVVKDAKVKPQGVFLFQVQGQKLTTWLQPSLKKWVHPTSSGEVRVLSEEESSPKNAEF